MESGFQAAVGEVLVDEQLLVDGPGVGVQADDVGMAQLGDGLHLRLEVFVSLLPAWDSQSSDRHHGAFVQDRLVHDPVPGFAQRTHAEARRSYSKVEGMS
jgi:hypothetical protein